jgi:hypothetical protein
MHICVHTSQTVAALTSASLRLCAVYVCVRKQNAVHATSMYVQFSYYDVRCLSGVPSMGALHTRGTEPFFFADEEKRKYLDRLDSEMTSGYTTIQDRHDTLAGFNGTKHDSDEDDKKADWRDRSRNMKHGKLGWKYTPKDAAGKGKGKEVERPHQQSATPMKSQATPMKPTPTASTSFTGDSASSDMGEASQTNTAVGDEM